MSGMRNIRVVPHDAAWREQFRAAAVQLSQVFGSELISIHHIGSTSIPGMCAKPVIDIMPVVWAVEKLDALGPDLQNLGYKALGEFGIPGRRHFVKGSDTERTHHLHCYESSHPEVARHLDFRDYLASHPEVARRYAALKEELAPAFRNDIAGYLQGKDAFIKATLQQAHAWRRRPVVLLPRLKRFRLRSGDELWIHQILDGSKTASVVPASPHARLEPALEEIDFLPGEIVEIQDGAARLQGHIRITEVYEVDWERIPEKLWRSDGCASAGEFESVHRARWADENCAPVVALQAFHFQLVRREVPAEYGPWPGEPGIPSRWRAGA